MDGDRERFEALFRTHYGAVVRYAVRRIGQDASSEVVAETFTVAWRRLDQIPDNALPWLYATARRVVANEVRRRSRAVRLDERLAAQQEGAVADHAEPLTESLRVRAALDSLSERDREVLRLSAWEQLPTADAASVLGCSESAYKVRLHRARRRLELLLADSDAHSQLEPEGGRP
ncbi:MAG TPA: RNA polymerase sigma factor [Jatrophihabitantaceae bacterium]|nr:RNA polymerase sigma factor [Jatrophihabitantaceae bacterium]